MRIKYFQPLADIESHYEDIIRYYNQPTFGKSLLETWNIKLEDKQAILEEREALRYLIACADMLSYDKDAYKPTIEVVNRLFNRHLTFLDEVMGCDASNVKAYHSKLIQKEYKACRHYLFQFSLPAWYRKLPEVVRTYENKYTKKLF